MRLPHLVALTIAVALSAASVSADKAPPLPASTHNLLVDAKVTSNLASFKLGLRGRPRDLVFDLQSRRFVRQSEWHEYGVGYGKDVGVVPESKCATWLAEWPKPVAANLIVLSGTYPNQRQPRTAWKIETRRGGRWATHARGKGGWYDSGRYVWGGAGHKPLTLDAIRVSVFSPDDRTPLKSIHFRGEGGLSWLVADVPPIDARIVGPPAGVRAGGKATFRAEPVAGKINSWTWDFGGGRTASGPTATTTFTAVGPHVVRLRFSDGKHTAAVRTTVTVRKPVAARIAPLTAAVRVGKPVAFADGGSLGEVKTRGWAFGDHHVGSGEKASHTYEKPGIYEVKLTVSDGRYEDTTAALLRVHTPETLAVPQVLLDTDQKNEQDDQHYFGYSLFSELDQLGVNSVHHGGGQEPMNYGEILHVLDLAKKSGLPSHRWPRVFRGANRRLEVPRGGRWQDTEPVVTDASRAILAAARGAAPTNPLWVVPVGPGTNVASAILQARAEGLKLSGRLRVMWLGGSNGAISGEFNGNNDPWSMYVVCSSGLETWIMPAPVGARVRIDKRKEPDMYPNNPLGRYLLKIMPANNKPLFDPSCLAAIISMRLGTGWVKESEPVTVAGPQRGYRWTKTDKPTSVRVIRQIDQQAMKLDIFNSMKGKPTRLIGAAAVRPAK